jgi:hypothetical protein
MTIDEMTPFLKGFYLTLDSWRPKRDADDWKVSDKTCMKCLDAQLDNASISELETKSIFQDYIGCPLEVTFALL